MNLFTKNENEEAMEHEVASEEMAPVVVEEREVEVDPLEPVASLLDERILRAVKDMGFTKFSPIQEQGIPEMLQGKDIIGQAQTGTGKTAAFGIPVVQSIDPNLKKIQAIILCPTRELAIQAAEEIRKLAKYMQGIKVLPVYGGQDMTRQIMGLKGTQIIVGTPGRVMDHMRRHTIKMDNIRVVVLDEADEMLNMGFREDMELILGEIECEHQTALFSATMPQPILDITGKFQNNPELIRVAAKELTIPLVSQKYYKIKNQDKDRATVRILEYYQPKLALVFCNTKSKVDELTGVLKNAGFQAEGLHGDMAQRLRDEAMKRFRQGATNILIATDVAARGIDVDDVEAVINYDIPQDIEYYVHRIGRTGRAGRTGRSFTFVTGREIFKVREIEKICRTTIEETQMPTAAKVIRSKAKKALDRVWEQKQEVDEKDLELMKKYIQRKMDEEECDAIDIAAAFLKDAVGEMGEDIASDDFRERRSPYGSDRGGRGGRGRGDRDGRDGRGRGDRDGRGREDSRGYGERRGRGSREEGAERGRRNYRNAENGDNRRPRRETENGEGRSRRRDVEGSETRKSRKAEYTGNVNEAFFYGEENPKRERKTAEDHKREDRKRSEKKHGYENLMNVLPKKKKNHADQ